MKRILCMVLLITMALSCFGGTTSFAQSEIKIIINGTYLTMDQQPIIVEGRTLVPLRAIFEALGATVSWDDSAKTAIGKKDGKEIKITINDTTAYVDGQAVILDVPAQLLGGRTLVPVRFISENLGEKVTWDDASKTVIITSENEDVLFNLTFDELTSFESNVGFITGGVYKAENVALTSEQDHTTGKGKSIKMSGRDATDDRLKFKNAFSKAEIGETYTVSAYVYVPEVSTSVSLGFYGDKNTDYAFIASDYINVDVPANTWTLIELEYEHQNETITQIGIDQRKKGIQTVPTIYVDDVEVKKNSYEVNNKPVSETLIPVTVREGKRPTPLVTGIGKTYDDLIFYDRTFSEETQKEKKTSDEMFSSLPKNPAVMADNLAMLSAQLRGSESDVVDIEKTSVQEMPFTEAIKATVKKVPSLPYNAQLTLASLDNNSFEEGDNMLIVFYMRTIDADNEFSMGRVQLIVEKEEHPNPKVLQEDVKTLMGAGWKKVYLPFVAKKGYTRLCIRLGYYIQTVEFGGYQILNYGKDVPFENLPSDTVMEEYDTRELFEKDVDWRKEAWDRINKIRKGDINVIVKDSNGNVIPDALVKIDMYDHEFKWGTAVNGNVSKEGEFSDKYREALSTFFNTGVSESAQKPVEYMNNPSNAKEDIKISKELGLKNFRGHTFVWDRALSKTYNEKTGEWISNTTVSEELAKLISANDKAGIDAYIENTIKTMAQDFEGEICDWDVLNEALNNSEIRTRYGNEVLKQWFEWAQKYDTTAKMYINETGIIGNPGNNKVVGFKQILDYMVDNNVDFDGIGVQGHFSTFVSPKAFYDELTELAAYGKEMKVTEFDMGLDMHKDEEAEASFMRDIMILAYSIEQMDGFLMWGFTDASHWLKNAPILDDEWNVKKTGEQYIDLVYNKWWTCEDGKTDVNGTYSTKGYYGDYLITATKDGKSTTVDTKCYKGNDNTIVITLD